MDTGMMRADTTWQSERAPAGDPAAFEALLRRYERPLYGYIARMLRDSPDDAADVLQETFLKFYRGIEGFHAQSSIGTWLCRILINTCHDTARKRRREGDPQAEEKAPGAKNHLPLKVALDDALGRIHPRYRMVFLLFEVEGFKHGEIAAILEVPEGTSKAWLFEAKKELKRMLTETRR